jgi:predicted ATPase
LAEACGIAGRFEEGLDTVAEAFATEDKTNERHSEANLHKVKGDLILWRADAEAPLGDQKEAEECYRKSIEVSHDQEAKSFELKAVLNLSQLWKRQRKNIEAKQALAEVYSWFTEGLDTVDLRDARALLDELNT